MANGFDDVSIPLRIGFGTQGGPSFSTDIITIDGGYERRNQNWQQARRRYDARTGLCSAADAAALRAFFLARAGRARGFRLKDWADFTSAADGVGVPQATDQAIGMGDGTTTLFQLSKTYSSGTAQHQRLIRKPVIGTVTVALNGVTQSTGWSLDAATGLVTFAAAPAAGVAVTAGYAFDVPVRFDSDTLNLTLDDFATQRGVIPLLEVRI
jgi:uncharacterized protein (TIGR02217 family)